METQTTLVDLVSSTLFQSGESALLNLTPALLIGTENAGAKFNKSGREPGVCAEP